MLQGAIFVCSRKGHSIPVYQANARENKGTGIAQHFKRNESGERGVV
jgi:hypothetical protein